MPSLTVLDRFHGLELLVVAAIVGVAWWASFGIPVLHSNRNRWSVPAAISVVVLAMVVWNVPRVVPLPGVTAACRDQTYSYSAHRSGTCSEHRGVGRWINAPRA
jgi:hypothetical protein